jgi:triacylglycerol lipase
MIPFDGKFAEDTVLPLAQAAYDSTKPPEGFVLNQTAFEILADPGHVDFQAQLARIDLAQRPQRQRLMQSMTQQPGQHQGTATDAAVRTLAANPSPNLHFGWVCVDVAAQKLIVAFRGTEFLHDWLDNFDFIPAPYAPIPGRGTVHEGFQLVYYAIRASLRNLVQQNAPKCKDLLITGHSLGGALCALAAPDLLNDIDHLSPVVYTWAEPRVGHDDFVSFLNTHVNVCYRIVNVWDVVPHLPPDLAGYEHEGSSVTIDSGFSLDVVHNHVLATGYAPGIAKWNAKHPLQDTTHFGRMAVAPMIGRTA